MSILETNFGCASVRKKSITYENNDSSKQRLVIVRTLHIEYDFSLKVFFLLDRVLWPVSSKAIQFAKSAILSAHSSCRAK